MDPTLAGLCLAILSGNTSAIGVLADRLEELNGSGLHVHIRRRKRLSRESKLLIVTLALPDRIADALACEFAYHALPVWDVEHPDDTRPRDAVEARLAWLRGDRSDDELQSLLSAVHAFYLSAVVPLQQVILDSDEQRSASAASAAVTAYGLVFDRPSYDAQAMCKLSGGGYHAHSVANSAAWAFGRNGQRAELDWQLVRTHSVVDALYRGEMLSSVGTRT